MDRGVEVTRDASGAGEAGVSGVGAVRDVSGVGEGGDPERKGDESCKRD